MGWIQEANKKEKYNKTHHGFRIYTVKEPEAESVTFEKDGEMYSGTEFTKGESFAIDKTGLYFSGWIWDIVPKIEKEIMRRKMSKRYGEELEWR